MLSAVIPMDFGSVRPRILACFQRFSAYKAAGDIAAVGWMLAAVQEWLSQRDRTEFHSLQVALGKAMNLLAVARPTVH